MKEVNIKDGETTVATLRNPEGFMTDKDFEEISTALLLTLANYTGRILAREDVTS